MRFDRMLIGALLLGMLALASSAYGISISVSSNAGGFTENINAGDGDSVFGNTIIGSDRLSNSIEGSGSLKESHSVSNRAGANAGVGVDIRNAERYSYDYYLSPDKASKSAPVMAGEELDVLNAEYIEANAQAFDAKGYTADVSTVIHDPGNQASLIGYRNIAMASKDEAMAYQTAESAFAPNGSIQADSGADFMQLKSHPLRFRWDTADASIRVDSGSLEGYSDLASASAQGIWITQQMDAATGERIRTKSESASLTASLFQGLKGANAKVSTTAEGNISGYNASARSSEGFVEADQAGHIVGTFTSTALAGKASKTRTSNYGTEYDFNMQARKDAAGSYATGTLGYYVDNVSPVANRIQGAVDASESGDAVNVAPGTYYENVQIDKSLALKGAGAGDTIVDGNRSGSVFIVGKNDPNVDVALSGMTIQGGSGTDTDRWPDFPARFGGGILNYGHLSVIESIISENIADYGGGGVFNAGTLAIAGSSMSKNIAYDGGSIYNDYGSTVTIDGSIISENTAAFGGGIGNHGTITITDCSISENTAQYVGGGVYNDWYGTTYVTSSDISENSANSGGGIQNDGIATITDSIISKNTADYGDSGGFGGGGVSNSGTIMIADSNISENTARYGGGIYNNVVGTVVAKDITVSKNRANHGDILNNSAWGNGGGIFNQGLATISDSNILENSANYMGGGIYNDYDATINLEIGSIDHNVANLNGGGISNYGNMKLNDSTISGNNAENGGGIFNKGIVSLERSSISNNNANTGGGILNYGTINLNGTSIDHNIAAHNIQGDFGNGGGIYNTGTITSMGSNILENNASFGGGIYSIGTSTITGSTVSGNFAFHGGGIYSDGTDTIIGCNISENNAYSFGGGIYIGETGTVTVTGSEISENVAEWGWGGGIINSGTANVIDSILSGNTARYYGGGILNGGTANFIGSSISGNTADDLGGGILNFDTVIVTGSNISKNTAHEGGGISNAGGSALVTCSNISENTAYNGGGIYNTGIAAITCSNISGNNATENGGGIFNFGATTVTGSTISLNKALYGGGIYNTKDYFNTGGTLDLQSGLISHNIAGLNGGGIYNNFGTLIGNLSIVHDNTPDQIAPDVDWLPVI